jgi:hypothetical protein
MDMKNLPPVKTDGWVASCPPGSPGQANIVDHDNPPPAPTEKSFIYDHSLTMDPCLHPQLYYIHGQFLSHKQGPVPHRFIPPQFSYCGTLLHNDIRMPNPINFIGELPPEDNPDWEDRVEERLVWRGSNTGIWHDENTLWRHAHRIRMMEYANNRTGTMTVLPPPLSRNDKVGKGEKIKKAMFNPAMFDVHFTGGPLNCPPGTCEILERMFDFRRNMNNQQTGKFKYVLDVSGLPLLYSTSERTR